MKKFFWIIIAVIAFSGCSNKEDNLAKMLFLLNQRSDFREYPCDFRSVKHYNVDSILAEVDTNMFRRGSRHIMILNESWLDSLCTDEQLIQLVNDKKKNNAVVRLTAYAALISRGYKGIEKMVLDNYKDTTKLTVLAFDYG